MAPELPGVEGQQPEEEKGEALGRQEEEQGGFTVAEGQAGQPDKVGKSKPQGQQAEDLGAPAPRPVSEVQIPSVGQAGKKVGPEQQGSSF
jgi:hypothetical protein